LLKKGKEKKRDAMIKRARRMAIGSVIGVVFQLLLIGQLDPTALF